MKFHCGHMFHIDCITTWLYTNDTCPFCRANIYADCIYLKDHNLILLQILEIYEIIKENILDIENLLNNIKFLLKMIKLILIKYKLNQNNEIEISNLILKTILFIKNLQKQTTNNDIKQLYITFITTYYMNEEKEEKKFLFIIEVIKIYEILFNENLYEEFKKLLVSLIFYKYTFNETQEIKEIQELTISFLISLEIITSNLKTITTIDDEKVKEIKKLNNKIKQLYFTFINSNYAVILLN